MKIIEATNKDSQKILNFLDLLAPDFEGHLKETRQVEHNFSYGWNYLILEEEKKNIGILAFHNEEKEETLSHIAYLAILENYRNKGYGKVLLKEAIRKMGNSGKTGVRVRTWSTNFRAIKFYTDLGFREIRREPRENIPTIESIYFELPIKLTEEVL